MSFKSNKNSECFDCGKAYKEGDELFPNGHKTKAGKDYFCPDGKNCQGAQKFQSSTSQSKAGSLAIHTTPYAGPYKASTDADGNVVNTEPTPEQFLELGMKMLNSFEIQDQDGYIQQTILNTEKRIAEELIKRSAIEKAMNDLGLQHPGRRGFIEDVLK